MKLHCIFWISLFSIASCTQTRHQDETVSIQPNIIVIMADDLGYETLGVNGGSSYQTPHLDQLAADGARFKHCYAQPLCTPSRVKLMTGIYNVRNYVEFGLLHESQTTFGHLFRDAGYETCVVGKWQLGKDPMSPRKAGFDEHCLWQVTQGRVDDNKRDTRFSKPILETNGRLHTYDNHDYGPDIVSQYGLDFMTRSVQKSKPFFLYYPMILTHCPFSPTPDSEEWLIDDQAVMTYKGKPEYFSDMMEYTDKIIGKIRTQVETLNVAENTIIIFVGDNGTDVPIVSIMDGEEIAGAKGKSTDAGTRVPLIVNWPGTVQPNQVTDELADLSDILPTLCEAASLPIPDSLTVDGKSFLSLITDKTYEARQYVYNWYSRSGVDGTEKVFARNQVHKLYQNEDFFNVEKDPLELYPLPLDQMDAQLSQTYKLLKQVILDNKTRRLEDIPHAL